MKMSTQITYGVRALCAVAFSSKENPARAKTFCEREKLPIRYIEQIFKRLKKAGIVKSVRGPFGGYYLAKKPQEVKVGDVIRIIEGRDIQLAFSSESKASRARRLRSRGSLTEVGLTMTDGGEMYKGSDEKFGSVSEAVWSEASELLMNYFDSVSIENLCTNRVEL
jgi:Rrf2 family transcriptional regulator, iron-sulfur cluster assembly transcription factor